MPEKKTKKAKSQDAKQKDVVESEVSAEEIKAADEKELLHEAELREKERKEQEDKEKEEIKKAAKEAKNREVVEKKAARKSVRVKPRHGKKYRKVAENVDKAIEYSIADGIKLAKETSITKFESTIELHIKLAKKLENVRGTFTMPSGAVKEKNVLQVTEKNIEEVATKVKAGKIDFDIMVAHPSVMPKLASMAKILGPKGLMPNPKSGTVSEDVVAAANEFKSGRVEYKADKSNNVHIAMAKCSVDDEKIVANIQAAISQFPANRIEKVFLSTTMGPSVRIKL